MFQACGTVVGRLGYKVKSKNKKAFRTEHNLQSPSKLNVFRAELNSAVRSESMGSYTVDIMTTTDACVWSILFTK